MNWSSYAKKYDLMASSNPSYQELLTIAGRVLRGIRMVPEDRILELGVGTGNFTALLAGVFPENEIVAVESNPEMLNLAENKCREQGFTNVEFRLEDSHASVRSNDSFALVVAVHTIYCSCEPHELMCQIFNRIQPGGDFFVIDIGRPINVKDWRNFIFGDLIVKVGALKACEILIDGLPVAKANHHIRKNQENGRYWIHSHVEFLQMLENTGFKVVASDKCYRDYSDWAHVKRPPENQRSEQVAP